MANEAAKRAWVERVLGMEIEPAGGGQRPLMPLWLDAKDDVDGKLSRLQGSLRGFGDPDLDRIAEFGLNGVTGTNSVGLMVALREADAPGAGPGARQKLAGAIESYRAFLDGSDIVKLIDDNPFGVEIGLHATLGHALDTLASNLGA